MARMNVLAGVRPHRLFLISLSNAAGRSRMAPIAEEKRKRLPNVDVLVDSFSV